MASPSSYCGGSSGLDLDTLIEQEAEEDFGPVGLLGDDEDERKVWR